LTLHLAVVVIQYGVSITVTICAKDSSTYPRLSSFYVKSAIDEIRLTHTHYLFGN
jgi:hypothetical protein